MKILIVLMLSLIVAREVLAQPLEPLAPLGTSRCRMVSVCDEYGNNCKWIAICE